jgi:hypothetical protein
MNKIYTCGSRPCNVPTTLEDIKNTINVLDSVSGYFNRHQMIGHEYSQALAALESTMRKVNPIEHDDYISSTSTDDFNVDDWKSIFKYNLWDAIVSYAWEQVEHEFNNGSIVTHLMDVRLRLDRALSELDGKRMFKNKIEWGYGLTWSELFNAFYAKIRWNVRWNIVDKFKRTIRKLKAA